MIMIKIIMIMIIEQLSYILYIDVYVYPNVCLNQKFMVIFIRSQKDELGYKQSKTKRVVVRMNQEGDMIKSLHVNQMHM